MMIRLSFIIKTMAAILTAYFLLLSPLLEVTVFSFDDNTADEEKFKKDAEDILNVANEFCSLARDGKIIGIAAGEKGWESMTHKITQQFFIYPSDVFNAADAKQFQKEIRTCTDLFKVDAKKDPPSKKQIRSFFCKRKEKIELMSVYFFEKGKWIKKK